MPKLRERLDGVFGVIVMPGNPLALDKGEQFVAVSGKALFAFWGGLAFELCSVQESIEPLDLYPMLSQKCILRPRRSMVSTIGFKTPANRATSDFISSLNGLFNISSFRSRMRWIRHFCCRQSIASYAA